MKKKPFFIAIAALLITSCSPMQKVDGRIFNLEYEKAKFNRDLVEYTKLIVSGYYILNDIRADSTPQSSYSVSWDYDVPSVDGYDVSDNFANLVMAQVTAYAYLSQKLVDYFIRVAGENNPTMSIELFAKDGFKVNLDSKGENFSSQVTYEWGVDLLLKNTYSKTYNKNDCTEISVACNWIE
mgnify:CR=1 FL=1